MTESENISLIPEGQKLPPGILKQKEKKDLEGAIRKELLELGSTFTKKDITSFLSLVETSKDLSELKSELEKNVDSTDKKEAIASILNLADQIRSWSLDKIRALEDEILKEKAEREGITEEELKQYYSHSFTFVKKLEEAKLGKNILTDSLWVTVWALDSVIIILKILLDLVIDAGRMVLSPKKTYQEYREHFSNPR